MHWRGVVVVVGICLVACGGGNPPPRSSVAADPVPDKEPGDDLIQPVKTEKQEAPVPIETGDPDGVEGGVEGGVVGGDLHGVVATPPAPPPPPPARLPPSVAPHELDANRIAGERNIAPDDLTRTEISRSGKDKLVGSYKLCINTEGNIASVSQLKSTGFVAYDQKIISTIRGEWRYRPFLANGQATAVCTAITFIYSQPTEPPPGPAPPAPPPVPPSRRS